MKHLKEISQFYDKQISKFGINSKGANWKSKKEQDIRFKYLLKLIEYKKKKITVADLGCGYGALLEYMIKNNFNISSYYGYDISKAMIKKCKERFDSDLNFSFKLKNKVDKKVDFCFSSGIFNVKQNYKTSFWKKNILESLHNLNKYSANGFAFNCLTNMVDWRVKECFYGSSTFFYDYCLKNFSKKIILYHDMPLYEWTMIIKK